MVGLKPLIRMWERVEVGRSDSDSTLFYDLMYAAEMTAKMVVAALVAAVDDDKDASRSRLVSQIVRADGIGDWATALTEVLTGPASQHLLPEARTEQRELTQKVGLRVGSTKPRAFCTTACSWWTPHLRHHLPRSMAFDAFATSHGLGTRPVVMVP